jgi:hypothetical protein
MEKGLLITLMDKFIMVIGKEISFTVMENSYPFKTIFIKEISKDIRRMASDMNNFPMEIDTEESMRITNFMEKVIKYLYRIV